MAEAFTRRRLLRVSAASGLALSAGWLASRLGLVGLFAGRGRGYTADPAVAAGLKVLSVKEHQILQAAARRILDGAEPKVAGAGSGAAGVDVAAWADRYLASLDPALRRDVKGLLQILEHGTLKARAAGGRFTALSPAEQDRVLWDWQQSRLSLRRQGFQALKAICCLAYYQDERSFASIGYTGPLVPARWEGP